MQNGNYSNRKDGVNMKSLEELKAFELTFYSSCIRFYEDNRIEELEEWLNQHRPIRNKLKKEYKELLKSKDSVEEIGPIIFEIGIIIHTFNIFNKLLQLKIEKLDKENENEKI